MPLPITSSRASPFSSRAPSRAGTPINFKDVVEAVIERKVHEHEGDSEAHKSFAGDTAKEQPQTSRDEETMHGTVQADSTGVIHWTDRFELPISSPQTSPFASRSPSRAGRPISFKEVVEAVIERQKHEGDSKAHEVRLV